MEKTQKAITQTDVARRAGVSRGAVSVVLSGNGSALRLSEETHQRVRRAAAELRYRPNALARGLASGRMNTIGLVSVSIDDSFIIGDYSGPLIQGVIDVASRRLQSTAIFYGHYWDEASEILPAYCDGRNDGLMFIAPNREILDAVSETAIPFIVVGSNSHRPGVTAIDIDDRAATRELITHLLERGHRRIAFLGGPDIDVDVFPAFHACFHLRHHAFWDTLREWGIEPIRPLSILIPIWKSDMWDGLKPRLCEILRLPASERPTAIFVPNVELTIFAVEVIREMGLRMPEDVSVVGFDDTPRIQELGITTVRQFPRKTGARAAEMLLALIDGEIAPGTKEYVESELVVRGSVANV